MSTNELLLDPSMLVLYVSFVAAAARQPAEEVLPQRQAGPVNQRYSLSGPLKEKFADPLV